MTQTSLTALKRPYEPAFSRRAAQAPETAKPAEAGYRIRTDYSTSRPTAGLVALRRSPPRRTAGQRNSNSVFGKVRRRGLIDDGIRNAFS